MRSSQRKIRSGLIVALTMAQAVVFACAYNVRDVGFVDLKTMPYQLYVYIDDATPESVTVELDDALFMELLDSNIDAKLLNVDTDVGKPGMHLLKDLSLDSYPSAILVSPKGYTHRFALDASNLEAQLDGLTRSPLRETLLEQVANVYGVVLVIEGPDAQENASIRDAATRSVRKIHTRMKMLPKAIANPPVVQMVTREQFEDERLLLWSLGVDPSTMKEAHGVILYGRGRQMGPVLKGEAITEERLTSYLSVIGADCECGLDRSWMQGTMIPLKWGDEIQEMVSTSLGFDPENPRTKMEISMTVAKGQKNRINGGSDTKNPDSSTSSAMSFAYSESPVQFEGDDPNIVTDDSTQIASLSPALFDGTATRASVAVLAATGATESLNVGSEVPGTRPLSIGGDVAASRGAESTVPPGRMVITIAIVLVIAISGFIVMRASRN